jgi:hypothetical protein
MANDALFTADIQEGTIRTLSNRLRQRSGVGNGNLFKDGFLSHEPADEGKE